jgi:glycerol-3-phosphate dehydrogenase (NAD(P)+)
MLNFSNVMKNNKIAVIGDGGWGTTLAILLHNKNYEVVLWSAFSDYASVMAAKRENTKYLPDIKIPEGVKITSAFRTLKGPHIINLLLPVDFEDTVLNSSVNEAPVISVY